MPRAGLSRAAVVDLALTAVDDGGLRGFEDLTLADVAGRAGVAVPSLYKHVRGLPELRRAVALVSVLGLTAVIEAATAGVAGSGSGSHPGLGSGSDSGSHPGSGSGSGSSSSSDGFAGPGAIAPAGPEAGAAALRAATDAVRAFARASPGRYAAAQGGQWLRDPDAAEVRAAAAQTVAAVAAVLELFGLPPEEVIDAVRMVRSALHGFVTIELEGGFGLPQDVDQSFDYLLDALVAALRTR